MNDHKDGGDVVPETQAAILIDAETLPHTWQGITQEKQVIRLLRDQGLSAPALILEVGFGAGGFLIDRINTGLNASTILHVGIDPMPRYAQYAGMLGPFGVEWVAAPLADTIRPVEFIQDPDGYIGYLRDPHHPVPPSWTQKTYSASTLDHEWQKRATDQSTPLWIRVDTGGGEQAILAGGSAAIAAADLVIVTLDLLADPDVFYDIFNLLEPAGLRCYRLVDMVFSSKSLRLGRVTTIFVRLNRLTHGLTDLAEDGIAATMEFLSERRSRNIQTLQQLAAQRKATNNSL